MSKVDWMVHHILGDYGPGGSTNTHTHGMEKYGHLNFQMVIPIRPEQSTELLNTICFEVQKGKRFEPGNYPGEFVYNTEFRLMLVRETGRNLLRVIVPDPNLRFPEDPLCEAPYKYQTEKMFEQ